MSTHTVYRFVERRGFEGLQAFTEPIPAVGEHDILVRARSVGLNFRDIAIATDSYPLSVKDRVIPCSDMVGEVAAVGRLATGFAVGDRVMAPPAITFQAGAVPPDHDTFGGPVDGLLAEYTVLPARATIKLPKSPHSFAEWAAFIGTGATVWNTFYGNKPLLPGESVLLQGMIVFPFPSYLSPPHPLSLDVR
ncbi:GroES-like protein [Durotheca rogersii]|uniref:GroES-like protein n=1 Tax=Durotheca rogersii TaxID=419775 RepID=UPI00221FA56B|nr:GroES-like protein [Durotheca rogersii]KAI5864796.1 GroES-like protein [Durotheca rogersii]